MTTLQGKSLFQNGENVYINYHVGENVALHNHDFIEISYVIEGRGVHVLGESHINIEKGDYFIINTGVPHGYKDIEEMTVYNCVFTADFLDASMLGIQNFNDLLDHYLFQNLALSDTQHITRKKFRADKVINDLFLNMHNEFEKKPNGYISILRMDILKLLVLTLRNNDTYGIRLPNRQNGAYNNIIQYLCSNYAKPISLKELARRIYVSPEHFCRTFKTYTGTSVWEFVKKIRIDKAKNLLLQTNKPIFEIAELVGYSDERHFTKVFKSMAGLSPSGYRKQHVKLLNPSLILSRT